MTLSPEALDYLARMLTVEVAQQVRDGGAEEPMPAAWTELHTFYLSGGKA